MTLQDAVDETIEVVQAYKHNPGLVSGLCLPGDLFERTCKYLNWCPLCEYLAGCNRCRVGVKHCLLLSYEHQGPSLRAIAADDMIRKLGGYYE